MRGAIAHTWPWKLILVLTLVQCYFGYAQHSNFERITVDHGLSQNSGNCIYQDDKGFMWIGTQHGLNRYDGYEFTVYNHTKSELNSISDNFINDIIGGENNTLWIATQSGLNQFSPEKETFIQYYRDLDKKSSLSSNQISKLQKDSLNNLWISSVNGIDYFNPNTGVIKNYGVDGEGELLRWVNYVMISKSGQVWAGGNHGLYKYNLQKDQFDHIPLIDKEEYHNRLLNHTITCILEDHDGNIWVGSNEGVFRITKQGNKKQFYIQSQKVQNEKTNMVVSLFQLQSEKLLLSSLSGLFEFNTTSQVWEDSNLEWFNLKKNRNTPWLSLFEDRSGVLWMGSRGNGVIKCIPKKKKIDLLETPSSWQMVKDGFGNLWVGTLSGLRVYNESSKKFLNIAIENYDLSDELYSLILDDNKNLWIGSEKGIFMIAESDLETVWEKKFAKVKPLTVASQYDIDIPKEGIGSLLMEGDILWAGSIRSGVFKMKLDENNEVIVIEEFAINSRDQKGIRSNNINDIKKAPNGAIWVLTDKGCCYWNEQKSNFELFAILGGYKVLLSNLNVCDLSFDGELLYIGSTTGLYEVNQVHNTYEHYSTKQGMPNDYVYRIINDSLGNLWISTNRGITKFNKAAKIFRNYDVFDGLQSNEFNTNASYTDERGKLYFGGMNGVNSFYPSEIVNDESAITPVITNFRVFNKTIIPRKTNHSLGVSKDLKILLQEDMVFTDEINLSHKHDVFSFEFSGLNYVNPKKNTFKYMLEGFDQDWVKTTHSDRKATYTNLDPGSYTFRLKAANHDGVWGEKEHRVIVTVATPYWETIWFRVGVGILIALILFVIFRVKLNQELLVQKNEEKIAMLKEIHHRIKNNLQIVNSLLSQQSRTIKDENVIAMFKEARNRVLSMAMLHEKMYQCEDLKNVNIKDHISLLVLDLVKTYKVEKNIKVDIQIQADLKMGQSTLVPLGLIINEIITNALKYAFVDRIAGTIYLNLSQRPSGDYKLIIGDDGVGYDGTKESKGLGGRLINSFVKQIKGSIDKQRRKGTFFKVTFAGID